MKKPKEVNPIGKLQKELVKKFVKQESVNWPRDMKIAKKLLTLYPDFHFWEWLNVAPAPSLAVFLTQDFLNYLADAHKKFSLDITKKVEIKLESVKIGEDVHIVHKPKTLLEFLK